MYDVLPPERICVLQIEDRRLHLNWTEAKSCSQSPFVEPIDYNVTYGNTAEMRTTQTSMLEFTTADMLSNNAEYIFQVTAITSNGKTSPCVSVSIAISPNSSPMQQCTVAMYECVNQNPSTTSDGSIVTTLMPHIPTFEPGMVTSSLQTDATQGTPSESQGVNNITTETGTQSAETKFIIFNCRLEYLHILNNIIMRAII